MSSVVLPEPDGPITATNSPAATLKLTPAKARVMESRVPNVFSTWRTDRMVRSEWGVSWGVAVISVMLPCHLLYPRQLVEDRCHCSDECCASQYFSEGLHDILLTPFRTRRTLWMVRFRCHRIDLQMPYIAVRLAARSVAQALACVCRPPLQPTKAEAFATCGDLRSDRSLRFGSTPPTINNVTSRR